MNKLKKLFKQEFLNKDLNMLFLDDFIKEVTSKLSSQFCPKPPNTNPPLRLSSLGGIHAFELLGRKMGLYPDVPSSNSVVTKLIFCIGDFVEAYINYFLQRSGCTILSKQKDVFWNGVPGHTDTIIELDGKEYLLEIKTASERYFKEVNSRKYPGNERGYLTQLLAYQEALGLSREQCVWVFYNKATNALGFFPLSNVPEEEIEAARGRALMLIDLYNRCQHKDDVYKLTQPPPPCVEQTRGGDAKFHEDGTIKLYPHYSVSNPEIMYILNEGKTDHGTPRKYILDYNYPAHLQSFKPNALEDALYYREV